MGKPSNAPMSLDAIRDLCRRAGGAALLQGKIGRLGAQYVLSLEATICSDGRTIYQGQVEANRKEKVLAAVSRLAREFRTKAGDSSRNLEQHRTPLSEATTSS